MVLLVAATAGGIIKCYGPGWWRHYQFLRTKAQFSEAQSQCAAHCSPPDRVVFEYSPNSPATAPEGFVPSPLLSHAFGLHGHCFVRSIPRCWTRWCEVWAPSLKQSPEDWPVFLHGRKTPDAKDLIVALMQPAGHTDSVWRVPEPIHWRINCMQIIPGDWPQPPQVVSCYGAIADIHATGDQSFKLFAPQPDPDDPTRFSVTYQLGDKKGRIDYQIKGVCKWVTYQFSPGSPGATTPPVQP